MKQHLIILSLALALSACASSTRSSPPRPDVDYVNETNPHACMIEADKVKRMTCIAIARKNAAYCAPIVEQAPRDFCIAAVAQARGQAQ